MFTDYIYQSIIMLVLAENKGSVQRIIPRISAAYFKFLSMMLIYKYNFKTAYIERKIGSAEDFLAGTTDFLSTLSMTEAFDNNLIKIDLS